MRPKCVFDLTLTQKDIYLDQLSNPKSPLYNVGGYIQMSNILVQPLMAAHQKLVEGDDIFGLRILASNQKQYISSQRSTELPLIDFSAETVPKQVALEWLCELFETPLEFSDCELFKAALLKIDDDTFWYVGFAHHLMMDGWGFSNWARRLGQLYNGEATYQPQADEWQDVVSKDLDYLISKKYQDSRQYWLEQKGLKTEKFLTPYNRFKSKHGAVSVSRREIYPLTKLQSLKAAEFAKQSSVGVAQVFLGLISSYFSNTYDRTELVFGLPAHNRQNAQQKSMLGVFTSVSPTVVNIPADINFLQLVRQIYQQQRRDLRHQRYPIGHMVNDLEQTAGHKSLYEVGYNYLKLDSQLLFEGKSAELVYLSHNHEVTPLMITVWEYGETQQIELKMDYNDAYFNQYEVQLLGKRLSFLLDRLLNEPEKAISDIGVLPEEEHQEVVENKGAQVDFGHDRLMHELFIEQAKGTPDQLAVIFESQTHGLQQLTYKAIDEQSNQLAHYLREQGVSCNSLVGIAMERSVEMVVSIMAILKAGGAYVPIDTSYPQKRIDYILEDSQIRLLLTQSHLAAQFPQADIQCIVLDTMVQTLAGYSIVTPDKLSQSSSDLAYVIYTSGSTGQPKGVLVEHRALLNRIDWMQKSYSLDSRDRVLQKTPYSFDVSVWEFVWTLGYGATLVVAKPDGHKDPQYLAALIDRHKVSRLHFVPSMLNAYLETQTFGSSVRQVYCSGEQLGSHIAKTLQKKAAHVQIHNLYGPTEAAIDVSYFDCRYMDEHAEVPIGKPIQNIKLLILNKHLKPCPIGVPGELHIGGIGLARGYLNKPELTAQTFVADPFSDDPLARLYKTGDLARMLPDKNLMFLSRLDSQVKINGIRIEVGEIEVALAKLKGISQAVVLKVEDRLVAYLASSELTAPKPTQLREQLIKYVPVSWFPQAFIMLPEIPLTSNGKVDQRALRAIPVVSNMEHRHITPATTDSEKTLTRIWGEVLKLDEVGIQENFFELGGDSMMAVRVVAFAAQSGMVLSVADIFDFPTVESLAKTLQVSTKGREETIKMEESAFDMLSEDDLSLLFASE